MQAGKTGFTGKLHDIWAQVRDRVNMVGMFIGVRENWTYLLVRRDTLETWKHML